MTAVIFAMKAPLSFVTSARRAWKLTRFGPQPFAKLLFVPLTVVFIVLWWVVDLLMLALFTILLLPVRFLLKALLPGKRKAVAVAPPA